MKSLITVYDPEGNYLSDLMQQLARIGVFLHVLTAVDAYFKASLKKICSSCVAALTSESNTILTTDYSLQPSRE